MTSRLTVESRPQLFKRWIGLPIGKLTIQWIEPVVLVILIDWKTNYPVKSAIQRLSDQGQV